MKTLLLSLLISLNCLQVFAGGGGEITGQVIDSLHKEALVAANVVILDGEKIVKATLTDIDGFYTIGQLAAGKYHIRISYTGYNSKEYTDVKVYTDQSTTMNIQLSNTMLGPVEIVSAGKDGHINIGFEEGDGRLPSTTLERLPIRPEQAAIILPGVFQLDYNQPITFRGSRVGTTLYMVDGMRIIGEPNLVLNSIEEEIVFEGGIPAKYGDTVGGVIVINTKSFHLY